ncbi:hypothetical protein MMC07_003513 [Pseudocyphellaria aurata]|nr:hypothetical protein [Pseudocyphellaria aurata]
MSRRSDLSNNWRVKADLPASSSASNGEAERSTQLSRSARHPPLDPLGDQLQDQHRNQQREHIDGFPTESRHKETNRNPRTVRGEDDPRTLQAIAEGRRVYVGNMPYMAKTEDVERLFADSDLVIEHINISIDPFSGRNPSYCFVELTSKEHADRAIRDLNGQDFLGRPIKMGPGVSPSRGKPTARKEHVTPSFRPHPRPTFDRWVRTDASEHWKAYTQQKRRLYVGGLPPMPNHYSVDAEVRNLFEGFKIDAVSKIVIPRIPGHDHRYLFVDFPTAAEAERARKAVNGMTKWGVQVRVTHARSDNNPHVDERQLWEEKQAQAQKIPLEEKQVQAQKIPLEE